MYPLLNHTIDEEAELFHTHLPQHNFKDKRKRKFFVIGIAKADGDEPTFYINIRAFNTVDALNIAYHRYRGKFIHYRFFDKNYFQQTMRKNYGVVTAIIYEGKKPFAIKQGTNV